MQHVDAGTKGETNNIASQKLLVQIWSADNRPLDIQLTGRDARPIVSQS